MSKGEEVKKVERRKIAAAADEVTAAAIVMAGISTFS